MFTVRCGFSCFGNAEQTCFKPSKHQLKARMVTQPNYKHSAHSKSTVE